MSDKSQTTIPATIRVNGILFYQSGHVRAKLPTGCSSVGWPVAVTINGIVYWSAGNGK